jgi:hypothetical protein
MKKTAVLIGYGGMGKRYFDTLKKMNFKIIAVCEHKDSLLLNLKKNKSIYKTNNYKDLLEFKADLICIATNTKSRFKIITDFCKKKKIKKIITEKPLSTSYLKCDEIVNIAKKNKIKLVVNTHRTHSPNWLMIKDFFKEKNEKVTSININSPSAGLGNMGSTFFDFGFFFFNTKPKSVVSFIDKTKTPNPRGSNFKDPGGYGIINYNDDKKLMFDLSENTGLPYVIHIKSKNYEFQIDEINNKFILYSRPPEIRKKPLYFYIFKPQQRIIKLKHKFDIVNMTKYSIDKLFSKNFNYKNLDTAKKIMECIFAAHISSIEKKIITLPLKKKYQKLEVNFA